MVDVAKMSNEYHHSGPVGQFKTSAGKFGCDLLELAELQSKLFQADAKLALEKSVGTTIIGLFGFCCLLGCMPVFFLGLASAISYFFDIESWVSQLAIGCSFSLISIGIVGVSLRRLATSDPPFQRSTEELSKNVEWAKDIVKRAAG